MPATPEFVRLARVTAAGLASRLGFTFDDVDDLRLAIDELCFGLIGSKGRVGTVQLFDRKLKMSMCPSAVVTYPESDRESATAAWVISSPPAWPSAAASARTTARGST